jgi:hypothetical protein
MSPGCGAPRPRTSGPTRSYPGRAASRPAAECLRPELSRALSAPRQYRFSLFREPRRCRPTSEERTVAKTLSVNIDRPAAGALVGPIVYVSGTVSVVGPGPPFVHQVDRLTVPVGAGLQVAAQVTGPANLNTFPRPPRAASRSAPRSSRRRGAAICPSRTTGDLLRTPAPGRRKPPRKRRARLPSISIWPMCGCLKAAAGPPGPQRERDGMQDRDWFAARRLVRTPGALTAAQPD